MDSKYAYFIVCCIVICAIQNFESLSYFLVHPTVLQGSERQYKWGLCNTNFWALLLFFHTPNNSSLRVEAIQEVRPCKPTALQVYAYKPTNLQACASTWYIPVTLQPLLWLYNPIAYGPMEGLWQPLLHHILCLTAGLALQQPLPLCLQYFLA